MLEDVLVVVEDGVQTGERPRPPTLRAVTVSVHGSPSLPRTSLPHFVFVQYLFFDLKALRKAAVNQHGQDLRLRVHHRYGKGP